MASEAFKAWLRNRISLVQLNSVIKSKLAIFPIYINLPLFHNMLHICFFLNIILNQQWMFF